MAVDLSDLVPRLRAEVNPPGTDLFPDATDNDFLLHMQSGFWEAYLDGIITDYEVNDDGIVTPSTGSTEFPLEYQQLVIIYAGMKIVRNMLLNLPTKFRASAGSVEYERQQSANTLREILKDMQNRKNILLERLSDLGTGATYYIDGVASRNDAFAYGDVTWTGS